MGTVCNKCSKMASHHRLTSAAVFYCLTLNKAGEEYVRKMKSGIWPWTVWRDFDIYRIPTKYLVKSDLTKEVGKAIQKGLDTYE